MTKPVVTLNDCLIAMIEKDATSCEAEMSMPSGSTIRMSIIISEIIKNGKTVYKAEVENAEDKG